MRLNAIVRSRVQFFSAAWRTDSDEDVETIVSRSAARGIQGDRHEDTAVTEAQGSILKSHKGA